MKLHSTLYLFLIIIVTSITAGKTAEASDLSPSKIIFAQLADTHIGMDPENEEGLAKAMDIINGKTVDFVVICGDLIQKMKYKKYKALFEQLNTLKKPYFLVPGNHDVGMIASAPTLKTYRKIVGKDYYDFPIKRCRFIVLNTQLWTGDVENETNKQDEWLLAAMKKNAAFDRIVVFGHQPLFLVDPHEESLQNSNIPKSKRAFVMDIFNKHAVSGYFFGHVHRHFQKSVAGVFYSSCESISVKTHDPEGRRGFRLWTFDTINNEFSSEFIAIDSDSLPHP